MNEIVTLHLSCASSHRLKTGSREFPELPTDNCFLLLLRLTQHRGRSLSRDQLAEELWGNVAIDTAKNRLRTELWRLKQYFDLQGMNLSTFLRSDRKHIYVLEQLPLRTDTEVLYTAAAQLASGTAEDVLPILQTLITPFECGVLQGFYHPWAEAEKSRVQQALRECHEHVFQSLCHQQRWRDAINHGQALLKLEPLDEYLHGELMRCYTACGCRGLAVRQYALCQKVLRDELGIAPCQSIEDLYRSLLGLTPTSRIRRVLDEEPAAARTL